MYIWSGNTQYEYTMYIYVGSGMCNECIMYMYMGLLEVWQYFVWMYNDTYAWVWQYSVWMYKVHINGVCFAMLCMNVQFTYIGGLLWNTVYECIMYIYGVCFAILCMNVQCAYIWGLLCILCMNVQLHICGVCMAILCMNVQCAYIWGQHGKT